jgi:uncharacterized protein (DUF433 family)
LAGRPTSLELALKLELEPRFDRAPRAIQREHVADRDLMNYLATMKFDDLKGIVHSDPQIMGGTPVFKGTRVPLQNLIDSLEGGESIDEFLEGYPSVRREQVIAVIEAGKLTITA